MVNALPAVVFKGGNKNRGCYAKKKKEAGFALTKSGLVKIDNPNS